MASLPRLTIRVFPSVNTSVRSCLCAGFKEQYTAIPPLMLIHSRLHPRLTVKHKKNQTKSLKSRSSTILSLYGKRQGRENPYSRTFCAVCMCSIFPYSGLNWVVTPFALHGNPYYNNIYVCLSTLTSWLWDYPANKLKENYDNTIIIIITVTITTNKDNNSILFWLLYFCQSAQCFFSQKRRKCTFSR